MSLHDQYRAAEKIAGACPLESGLIGALADNECEHGRLPTDTTRRCGCWREEGAVLKVIQEPQHLQALKLANTLRLGRGQARKDVAASRRTVADVLADPCCANARVAEVLAWQPRWGEAKAGRFLMEHDVCTPFQTAGHLTDRQRALIARALRTGLEVAA